MNNFIHNSNIEYNDKFEIDDYVRKLIGKNKLVK